MKTKLAVLFLGAAVTSTFTTAAAASEAPFVHMAVQAADSATIVVNAPRGRVDTAVFGKRPFMRSPRLSPDGTKIAVMMTKDGVDFLGYIDATKPGSAPVFFAQAEEFREAGDRTIGSWRFVGNRTIVFTVASREILGGRRSDVLRLVTYDLETKK